MLENISSVLILGYHSQHRQKWAGAKLYNLVDFRSLPIMLNDFRYHILLIKSYKENYFHILFIPFQIWNLSANNGLSAYVQKIFRVVFDQPDCYYLTHDLIVHILWKLISVMILSLKCQLSSSWCNSFWQMEWASQWQYITSYNHILY